MDDAGERSTSRMSSVLRSFEILEEIARRQPTTLSELVKTFGYSKSTVQRTLTTLQAAGWIQQSTPDTASWEITTRPLRVRPKAFGETELYARAHGPMHELRDHTNETIHLSALNGLTDMVLIDRVDCDQAVRTFSPLGDSSPLHSSAVGKAALAHLPAPDIETVIARGLPAYSPHTITDADRLREDLELTRRRGYSLNESEYRSAVCAVGAPIFDAYARPVAAICVSIPQSRYGRDDAGRLGRLTRETADRISTPRLG